MTNHTTIIDLDPDDTARTEAAARFLADSVHKSIVGLVPYSSPKYAGFLRAATRPPAPMRTLLVRMAVRDSHLVGAADWRILPDRLFLNGLTVSERHRGTGVGRELVADGLRIADSLGLTELGLDVIADNSAALSLYGRMGFTLTTTTGWYELPAGAGSDSGPARATDWPSFRAHHDAYGFGDLTLRLSTGDTSKVRLVGRTLRSEQPEPAPGVRACARLIGVERITCTAAVPPPGDFSFLCESVRMLRKL
ncbi:GNAT family N-acetyltransferase [Krasilnikovia sp. MM14-A1259]|uniref:GNAT family N-acetyltransferase n=1 Tax=Krasilnikovia sp. MM14-A1259 TaxID=3373539 RepID=UPI0038155319